MALTDTTSYGVKISRSIGTDETQTRTFSGFNATAGETDRADLTEVATKFTQLLAIVNPLFTSNWTVGQVTKSTLWDNGT